MKDIVKFRLAGIGIVLAMCAVFGLGVMLLWNALMPQIFGLQQVGYLQAAGLLLLARLLFGGIDHRHPAHPAHHEMHHGGDDRLFRRGDMLRERWLSMSEKERKAFVKRNIRDGDPRFANMKDFFGDEEQSEQKEGGHE